MVRALHAAGHRGHPRRGLQPHRGGGRAGPDAVAARASTTGATTGSSPTPAGTPTTPAAATPCTSVQPARAAPDHGLAALLGDGDGRGRLPLRPGGGAGPLDARRRHAVPVPRGHRPGPGAAAGEADRRAVGRGLGRLPGGGVPAAVDGVERPLPGRRTGLLARRAARRTGSRATGCRGRATCTPGAGGARTPRSTSSPRTTASPCATWCPTSASTTRPTARATGTGPTTTASWNCGAEGETRRRARIGALRRRQLRNLLTTLLLSTGVPMLVAGDEMGRTQGGNNNAYCQDNEIELGGLVAAGGPGLAGAVRR